MHEVLKSPISNVVYAVLFCDASPHEEKVYDESVSPLHNDFL